MPLFNLQHFSPGWPYTYKSDSFTPSRTQPQHNFFEAEMSGPPRKRRQNNYYTTGDFNDVNSFDFLVPEDRKVVPCRNEEFYAPECVQYNRKSLGIGVNPGGGGGGGDKAAEEPLQGCVEDDQYPLSEIVSQLTKYELYRKQSSFIPKVP